METLCLPFYSKQQTPWNMMMNGNGINMNGINIKSEPQDVVMNDYQHQHQHANNMSSNYGNSLMANATTQQVNGHHNHNHSHNHGHNQSFNPNGLISLVHIQNLALKECAKEIDVACEALNISADPFNWSVKDVQNWLVWTQKQFNLQPFPLDYFAMDGMTLCSLNEADFKQRAPHCGDILYAQLDIWKTAVEFRPEETILEFSSLLNSWSTPITSPTTSCASLSQASGCSSTCPSPDSQSMTSNGTNNHSHIDQSLLSPVSLNATLSLSPLSPEALSPLSVHSCGSSGSSTIHSPKSASIESSCGGIVTSDYGSDGARSDDEISCYDGCDLGNVSQNSISNGTFTAGSPASHSESTSHSACSPASSNSMSGININHQHEQNGNSNSRSSNQMNTTGSSRSGSGSHIHLWQFLKELLAEPQLYGSCIRWLDRPKGIFKIEDSVRVARLWGKRKNRPAMNYDKLSRSIRQYYKKGIMKKTERSQRLVYQFCHPYCL